MTRVKICGITRLEDALAAIDLGAAALGFNFYPASPRYIPVRRAARIAELLPPFVAKIGVVVNFGSARNLQRLVEAVGLDGIQLHGDETMDLVRALRPMPVIKAFRVGGDFKVSALKRHPASAILLDGFVAGQYGGTGKVFDWKLARQGGSFHRIILSGGLTPDNVSSAIRQARPFAVDVASGVESSPGKKDHRKLRAFFTAVRRTDQELFR